MTYQRLKEETMNTLMLTIALIASSITANAETTYVINGKSVTKLEALRVLLKDSNASVQRCADIELTDKATLKNKKVVKTEN